MKKDLHPDYHDVTIIMTDGSSHIFRSTMGKEGDTLRLDVDPKSHPAWTGGSQQIIRAGQLDRFQKKFANFGAATTVNTGKKGGEAA